MAKKHMAVGGVGDGTAEKHFSTHMEKTNFFLLKDT